MAMPIKMSGASTRTTLRPAVSWEMISFLRDIRLSEKSSASMRPTGMDSMMVCGTCVT